MPPPATVRLQLDAGAARPDKVAQRLGPLGVNIMAFVERYNEATAGRRGQVVPVDVTVHDDRSFALQLRTPPTSQLLRQAAGIERGAGRPNGQPVGRLTRAQLRAVAEVKLADLNTDDVDAAMRTVAGTARSMGIEVVG